MLSLTCQYPCNWQKQRMLSDGRKASCLLRGNYINQKTQKHSFSGKYPWISNQFWCYFTVWTMIYVIAGKQTLLCKPLKTGCRFKGKNLTKTFVLSEVSFYQITPRGKWTQFKFNGRRTSTRGLSCRNVCIDYIWNLCTISALMKLSVASAAALPTTYTQPLGHISSIVFSNSWFLNHNITFDKCAISWKANPILLH